MALGFSKNSGGDFLPIIKYDARAGRMVRKDGMGDDAREEDITDGFKAIFDMDAIEVGWMAFPNGKPDFHLVGLDQVATRGFPAAPSKEHKQGFRLRVRLPKDIAGPAAVREFSHSSALVRDAFDQLHDRFVAERPNAKLPVVTLAGVEAVRTKMANGQTSTNYKPRFEIAAWIDRPVDLASDAATANGAVNGSDHDEWSKGRGALATGSTLKPPPAQTAKPAPEGAQHADDFG